MLRATLGIALCLGGASGWAWGAEPDAIRTEAVVLDTGVVRVNDHDHPFLFLQDKQGGMTALAETIPVGLKPSDRVLLEGRLVLAAEGRIVHISRCTRLGSSPLPAALPATWEEIAGGSRSNQRVEVRGVIRYLWTEPGWASAEIVVDGAGILEVLWVSGTPRRDWPEVRTLLHRSVRVRGVAALIDGSRYRILVPATSHASNVSLEPAVPSGTRTVRGVVTAVSGNLFAVQGSSEAVWVHTRNAAVPAVGDHVQVSGYPLRGRRTRVLSHGQAAVLYRGSLPPPSRVSLAAALDSRTAGLISFAAAYRGPQWTPAGVGHIFESDNRTVSVAAGDPALAAANLSEPGTNWLLTGAVEPDIGPRVGNGMPHMRLRNQGGIVLTGRPSWWTPFRIAFVIGSAALLVGAWIVWVGALRRRVRQQTRIIENKIRSEAALEQRYSALLERVYDMVFCCRTDGTLISVNAAAEKLTGYTAPESGAANVLHAVAPHARAAALQIMGRVAEGERVPPMEVPILRANGDLLHLEVSLRHAGADLIEGVARDITERLQTTEALRQARDAAERAAHARSEFLANMSHEIRTPMNGVVGMTQLLEGTPLSEEQREYVQTLRSSADLLLGIINDILDLSRIEAGRFELREEPFVLRRTLRLGLRPLADAARGRGLRFDLVFSDSLARLYRCDDRRLLQVLNNLVANAVKFTSEGEIVVSVAPDEAGRIRFAVRDTGMGIPPDKLEHVFGSFCQADSSITRRFGGTGLGLAISSRIVEMMGGRLEVASTLGAGSEFSFTLPLQAVDAEPAAPSSQPAPPASATGRLLLVEDNAVNQLVATRMLMQFGYAVDRASNGREAVDLARRNSYAAILMDIQMPELDGLEAARRIRAHERKRQQEDRVPIIAMTAHVLEEDRERCRAAGMDRHIGKPLRREELYRTLATLSAAETDPRIAAVEPPPESSHALLG